MAITGLGESDEGHLSERPGLGAGLPGDDVDDAHRGGDRHPVARATLIHGDARDLPLKDESVQCIVTSPPYWSLRDYGLAPTIWDYPFAPDSTVCMSKGGYALNNSAHEWTPAGTLTKRGAPIASSLNMEHSPARIKKVKCGEFCIHCDAWKGCLGLEPTIDLYIQHLVGIFNECKRVLRSDGTAWVNIGDCYDNKTGQRWLVPHRLALALQDAGWVVRSDIIWAKGISFCRSYAGSVMPESVRNRPTCSHEHLLLLTKGKQYYYDIEAVREVGTIPAGTLAAKGSGDRQGNRRGPSYAVYDGGRNLRDVWTINTKPFTEAHFATFPPALVRPILRAGTAPFCCDQCGSGARHIVQKSPVPTDIQAQLEQARTRTAEVTGRSDGHTSYKPSKGYRRQILADYYVLECEHQGLHHQVDNDGLQSNDARCNVLDPFCGSGTVGLVCAELGRNFIGIDANPEYLGIATRRLDGGKVYRDGERNCVGDGKRLSMQGVAGHESH